jgi:hypothetical protein
METPEERRERIDGARRDQAELLRQVGYEHAGVLVRPSAAEALTALNDKVALLAAKGTPVRCTGKAKEFLDYSATEVPSPGRAKMMCAGCDAFAECDLYAQVEKPGWGVYGGRVYGKDLADKERREFQKEQMDKMKEDS